MAAVDLSVEELANTAVSKLGELEWNRFFLRESFKAVTADPGRILSLAFVKLKRMWNPFPNVDTYQAHAVRAISALWMFPLYAGAVIGAVLIQSVTTTILSRGVPVEYTLIVKAAVVIAVCLLQAEQFRGMVVRRFRRHPS